MIIIKIKALPAIRGLVWIQQGYTIFRQNPVIWLALSLANFVFFALLEQLDGAGALLSLLLSPVLVAGWLIGSHALAHDQPLKFEHLWSGFQHQRLFALGGVVLLTLVLISGIVVLLGGDTLANIIQNWQPTDDPEKLVQLLGSDGVSLMLEIFLLISIPMILLGLSMQFAPMLIVFNDLPVWLALKISTRAFLANIPSLTLYSLVWLLGYFMLLPLPQPFHTVAMIVLSPIIAASAYAAYYNIFPIETPPDQPAVTEADET